MRDQLGLLLVGITGSKMEILMEKLAPRTAIAGAGDPDLETGWAGWAGCFQETPTG